MYKLITGFVVATLVFIGVITCVTGLVTQAGKEKINIPNRVILSSSKG